MLLVPNLHYEIYQGDNLKDPLSSLYLNYFSNLNINVKTTNIQITPKSQPKLVKKYPKKTIHHHVYYKNRLHKITPKNMSTSNSIKNINSLDVKNTNIQIAPKTQPNLVKKRKPTAIAHNTTF